MSGQQLIDAPSDDYVTDLIRNTNELICLEFVTRASPVSVFFADLTPFLANHYRDVKFVRVNADQLKRSVEIENCVTFPSYILWKQQRCVGSYIVEEELGGTSEYKLHREKVARSLDMLIFNNRA